VLRIQTPWIFTLGAGIYDTVTAQEPWRRHCESMAAWVPGGRVLDLGVGPGVSAIELVRAAPSTRVVGIDTSAPMLARARRHGQAAGLHLALVRGDAQDLPFATAAYDGATGHSFLYLLRDRRAVLREVHRVVRPGGSVAFLEPNDVRGARRWAAVRRAFAAGGRFGASMLLWSVFSALHGRYTDATLGADLAACGFTDLRVTATFDGLGLVAVARRP
jgi:ubiquinone/menaquinone biosynthesis C-methylase UbiE